MEPDVWFLLDDAPSQAYDAFDDFREEKERCWYKQPDDLKSLIRDALDREYRVLMQKELAETPVEDADGIDVEIQEDVKTMLVFFSKDARGHIEVIPIN